MGIYESQKTYFKNAYIKGEHGWPVTGTSSAVVHFLKQYQTKNTSGRVLDIGCGEGRHTALFADAGYQSVGFDYQPLALSRALHFFDGDRSHFQLVQGDVFHLPFAQQSFDVLIDYGCLHHVRRRDTKAYLEEVLPLLKPNGYFLLSCFSENFKHDAEEKRRRNWLVHRGHYDRFFEKDDFHLIFGETLNILQIEEEREALYAFYHVLMQKKQSSPSPIRG